MTGKRWRMCEQTGSSNTCQRAREEPDQAGLLPVSWFSRSNPVGTKAGNCCSAHGLYPQLLLAVANAAL